MSDKIMLLDGHSLLNRAFYGLPDLTNAEGKHTNAVLGFLNIMPFRMSGHSCYSPSTKYWMASL